MSSLTLRSAVDVEILQEIQERFSDATGFAVIIADEQGVPVTRPTNFTNFCTKIRSSRIGSQCCIMSDKEIGLTAAKQGKPVKHYCHSGLVDLAAPIVLKGRHLGSVLCGQVLIRDHDEKKIKQIEEKIKHLPISSELLKHFLEEIELTSKKQIEAATGMLQLVAEYIIKLGAEQLVQKEINKKNQMLIKEVKLRTKLETLLQDAQLKILQSQINPHFLFNTLNTITRLAYIENAEQTANITYSLAKIMRYSLRNMDQLVTLKEELDYINNYLNIQQSRFRNKIHYEEVMDINVKKFSIPILSIQPLIENAIIHGFESQADNVIIKIYGALKKDRLVLEISDTGAGMTKEKLSSILLNSNGKSNGHTTGIGMNNVHKRIQYYFGKEYGITEVKSQIGVGTKVRIETPNVEVAQFEHTDCR